MTPKRLIACISCHSYVYPKHDQGGAHHNGPNESRSKAIRETWFRTWKLKYSDQIDLKFFLGRSASVPREDEVFLDCADDYYSLPRKVQKMFEWAAERDYDQVAKIDDDVWLWVDRLLSNLDNTDYKGFVLESADGKYTSGTAYWLSNKAMKIIAAAPWNPTDWAEDKWVGKVLAEHGIFPVHDERFQCCHCKQCKIRYPESDRISTHTVDPKEMYVRV